MIALAIFAVLAGAALPLQAGVNSQLRTYVGSPAITSTISFAVGVVALMVYVVIVQAHVPSIADVAHAPWWVWAGGVLGAFFVVATIVGAPRLGATLFFGLLVAGQMANSLVLENYGLAGYATHPVTLARIIGIILVIGGVIVIRAS